MEPESTVPDDLAIPPELMPADAARTATSRALAHGMARLSDDALCHLLREVPHDTLQAFVWFMKDAALLRRLLDNLTQRAAESFMDDLETRWAGRDPDQAPEVVARQGREAVEKVVAAWQTFEGQP